MIDFTRGIPSTSLAVFLCSDAERERERERKGRKSSLETRSFAIKTRIDEEKDGERGARDRKAARNQR